MPTEYDLELYKLKAEISKTFSDPKRLMIINELRDGEKQVSELAQALKLPQAVVSRQLALLRTRGVVTPRREGTSVYYSLTDLKIIEACDLVHQVLLNRLQKNKEFAERLFNLVSQEKT
ncbi:MAG: metalloregulator ArsR/SmtB family transcription factor [Dehalococcoidales bacterium]|jgi:ArsR family transcriptional regulator|nr:metalloregulator ArsR/SmtB family transcription factor [Dehalococcoidales bacterium]